MIQSEVFNLNVDLSPEQQEMADKFSVQFLVDENGEDWYDSQRKFSPDTWKISVLPDGRISEISRDISMMFPLNCRVMEFAELPTGISVSEPWYVDLKTIDIYRNENEVAELMRDELIKSVTERILPLQQAQEDGDAEENEVAELMALRSYRTALRRLDITTAPSIDWPDKPFSVEK